MSSAIIKALTVATITKIADSCQSAGNRRQAWFDKPAPRGLFPAD